MLEFLLMGLLLYISIVGGFCVISMVLSSAFEVGGWLGIVGLIVLLVILCAVISKDCGDNGKKK